MNENEEDKMRDHIVNRIVELASTSHAEDMKAASGVLQEYFSRKPDDEHFVSDGDQGTFDTGFGMMVFAGTMSALFKGTAEVLAEVADLPRGARRRLQKVEETIKKRHMGKLREIGDGCHDDQPEQD